MTIVKRIGEGHLVINIIDFNQDIVILVIPGGGYALLSNRESGPVATRFNILGYNTAVLYYTCKPLMPLKEGVMAVEELSKDFKNIVTIGFSAGGHLAGFLGTNDYLGNLKIMVLCYPVVSLYKHQHDDTAHNLLGDNDTLDSRIKYSIEERVTSKTVPCYIWTTSTDELVPYENTLMLIDKLKEHNIKYEAKIYDHGCHGLALADETSIVNHDPSFADKEIAHWPYDVDKFIKKILNK